MNTNETLNGLIEQAACCVNMLSSTDLSEAGDLRAILDRITDSVGRLGQGSEDIRVQLEQATSEAAVALKGILEHEVKDTSTMLHAISQSICTLQDLTAGLDKPVQRADAGSDAGAAAMQNPASSGAETREAAAAAAAGAMTISEEDAPLVLDFISEANEHVETAESALLELENQPDDNELINKIFRGFHTIKGLAGFLNLTEIGALAHSAESLLDLARKGQLVLAGDSSDVAFASLDMLKKMLAGLKDAAESHRPVPSQPNLAQLLETLRAVAQGQTQTASPIRATAQQTDRKLEGILEDEADTPRPKASATASTAVAEDKIKVSTTRLDNLINMSGELVIAQLMVAEESTRARFSRHELARKVAHQGKIVRELQELSMSMRMVPVQGVFQKMTRLARDLSRKAGKPVDFVTVGEDTELDRTVVDKIADPLIHLVRNSIDHGIEPGEDRLRADKNAMGRVELRAFHQAGNIVIEIEDDGKGLDKDRILKKAVEAGAVEPDAELAEEDIFKLIFLPGLSTAEKVTSISGRGVGMDVVKKNIEALRGKTEIRSARGKGTTFTIRLPLTLAVIDGQIVGIGKERYIIPINAIVRSLRPTRQQVSSVQGRGELVLERGELLPMIRLYRLLNIAGATEDPTKALLVVVEEDGKKCCLLVDDLQGQQQVVIKSLGEAMGTIVGVSGGAIMGDGKVSLILDVPGLVKLAEAR